MLNRTLAPELKEIDKIDFIAPKKYEIDNGIVLYHMKDVPNETSRFDLYFDAGKCRGEKGIPAFVNGLLLSGTSKKSSTDIQEEINRMGGFMESGISVETSTFSMYCLREYLVPILETVTDAISNLAFHEHEVKELLADRKQQLKINEGKVNYLAQRMFQAQLFQSNKNYSNSLTLADFDTIQTQDLKDFHAKHYLKGLQKVVVVGDLEEDQIQKIIALLKPFCAESLVSFEDNLQHQTGSFHVEKKGAIQSAIRVGRILFTKKHEDYLDFIVLNTILGDYFGSRLMNNIREDKGYTYGIGSMVAELNECGYFLIATEVGSDVKDLALKEIRFEIDRLQTELVSEAELGLVRNYMLGQLLKSADGPYAMTDLFLSAEMHGKELDFYNLALEHLHAITPERILELANKYLKWEDLTIVTAG